MFLLYLIGNWAQSGIATKLIVGFFLLWLPYLAVEQITDSDHAPDDTPTETEAPIQTNSATSLWLWEVAAVKLALALSVAFFMVFIVLGPVSKDMMPSVDGFQTFDFWTGLKLSVGGFFAMLTVFTVINIVCHMLSTIMSWLRKSSP